MRAHPYTAPERRTRSPIISVNQKQILGLSVIIGGWILISIGIGLLLTRGGDDSSSGVPASEVVQTATATPTSLPTTAPTAATEAPTATPTSAPPSSPTPTATPTPSPTPDPTPVVFSDAEVESFLDGLGAAGTAADFDSLMAWLHPAVFDRYGEAACRSYLETIQLALTVQVREVFEPAPWEWTTDDGGSLVFDNAVEIEVSRNINSQTFIQLMHLVPVEDRLAWLTDCGEPAP